MTNLLSAQPLRHIEHIQKALPNWILKTPEHKRRLLEKTSPRPPAYSHDLPGAQRTDLHRAHIAHWDAHTGVEVELNGLQDIYRFAEPLLKQALHAQYKIDLTLDVQQTYINLYIPLTLPLPLIKVKTGAFKTWKVSILDAALHNFEAFEAEEGAHAADSGFIIKPTAAGYYKTLDTLNAQLPVSSFIQLCRQLDIGGQYQNHLNQQLGTGNKSKELKVKTRVRHAQRTALSAAMHYALAREDISADVFRSLSGLGQAPGWTTEKTPRLYPYAIKLLDTDLIGALLFSYSGAPPSGSTEVIAYLPDDPQHPLKRYASMADFLATLAQKLRNDSYQQYFSRFITHAQTGSFFSALHRALWRTLSDPVRIPEGRPEDYPPAVETVPIERPVLTFSLLEVTQDYSEHLYRTKRQKVVADAPLIAVPTDTEDQKTRHDRNALLIRYAQNALTAIEFVAAPFVPVLGELMLAQMAWQIMDDTYEGIRDWTQGKTIEAWDHLFGVIEGVVQAATFAIGGKIIGDALTLKPSPFIDSLKPVSLPSSETRLWEPDLSPYEHPPLPAHLQPTETGLYLHDNAQFLPLAGKTFRVEQAARPAGYRIRHPRLHRTYSPRLRHNGSGVWLAETEQPLHWTDSELFKRLSPANAAFSEPEIARILAITHTEPAELRRVVSDLLPTPALLADTLDRFRIDADIERFIIQLEHADPAVRRLADPQIQLQLLTSDEQWPRSSVLTIVSDQGVVIAQYPTTDSAASPIRILESQLRNGDLPTHILQKMSDRDIRVLLGTSPAIADPLPGMQERTTWLYKRLAKLARNKRMALFDSQYRTLELRGNAEVRLLQEAVPGLPTKAAQALVWHASGDEVLQLLNEKTIPLRLREEARWLAMESRINRAYEGLFLDSVNNPDSEWLILKTIESLPGWSKDLRLEVRADDFTGTLLNSLGNDSAPIRKVLIKSANRYSAFDARGHELHGPDDLYGAVLHALPDLERKALGFSHPGQGQALKDSIRQHPLLPRLPVSQYLQHPVVAEDFKSPMQLAYGRVSYPLLGADAPGTSLSAIETQVHELYPSLNARERARVMAALPQNEIQATQTLADRQRELTTLRDDLEVWTLNAPAVNQRTGDALSPNSIVAIVQDRRAFSRELERCWRRQTAFDNHYADPARDGFELTFTRTLLDDMPTLNADFSHVTYLSLNGRGPITHLDEFLQHFPRLRSLELRGFELDRLPEAILSMQNLTDLRLEDSAIMLTEHSATGLAALELLEFIDLDNNPLNITPDFSNMPNLNTLHLRNTELTEFPLSLLGLSELEVVDLSENLITHVPADVFEAPHYLIAAIDLEENPLSQESLTRVRELFAQSGYDLNVSLDEADEIEPVLVGTAEP